MDIKSSPTRATDGPLFAEWKTIDLEPLLEIGFTSQHLSQLAKQGELSAQIIQDSIYAFAFDLKRNGKANKIKNSPLNYFMSILRNGQPYAFPANYESPQTEAMRLYIERKEAIREREQALEAKVAVKSIKGQDIAAEHPRRPERNTAATEPSLLGIPRP